MQIKYLGKEQFEIKTIQTKVGLNRGGIEIEGMKIAGPGEYERRGVSVEVVNLKEKEDLVYICHIEDIAICYPGILNQDLNEEVVKEIGDIDILFVPLGEENSLNVKSAQKLIADIDPRVVIPMLYADLEEFKSAEGITDGEVDTLKIKKIDLPQEERKFYILKPNV